MVTSLQSTLMRIGLIFVLLIVFYKPIDRILASIENMIDRSNATNIKFQGFDIGLSNKNLQSFDKRYQVYKKNLQMSVQLPILAKYRNVLKKQLIEAKLDTNAQIDILLSLWANSQLALSMLNIDKQLSEEQIEFLSYLNDQITPVQKNKLLSFFKQVNYKAVEIDFDRLLKSLLTLNLITREISSGYSITDSGKAYLIFRIWSGYPITFQSSCNKYVYESSKFDF